MTITPPQHDRPTLATMEVEDLIDHAVAHIAAEGCITTYVETVTRYLSALTSADLDDINNDLLDLADLSNR
jgi:hypothetical protein